MTAPSQTRRLGLRPIQLAAVAVGIVMALLVVLLVTRKTQGDDAGGPTVVGMTAPAIDGKPIIGERFDIGANDRWLVVNFFATWCVPCAIEHPELQAFAREHRADGQARVVSVVYDEDDRAPKVKAFFEKRGTSWTVLDSDDARTPLDWRVRKVPESFLVSPTGIVVERFVGGVTRKMLDDAIDAYTRAAADASGSSDGSDGAGGSGGGGS